MQNEYIKTSELKQVSLSFEEKDKRLLSLQEHITEKISRTVDEHLIKHYLRQVSQIASERLQLRKAEGGTK